MHYNVKKFINDEYKITIKNNSIHIYNYKKILDISNTSVIVIFNDKNITIYGKSLIVNMLSKNEILISGNYEGIKYE